MFEDVYPPKALVCAVFGNGPLPAPTLTPDEAETIPADLPNMAEPSGPHAMFYYDLPYRKVSRSFLLACAELLTTCADGAKILPPATGARIMSMADAAGRLRLVIGNDRHDYNIVEIDAGRPIGQLRFYASAFGTPPAIAGSRFHVRLPPRGAVMADLA